MNEKISAVLLGCGTWGTPVLKEMVDSKVFSHIVIGDIDIEKAKRVATELGGNGVSLEAVHVNADDPKSLIQVIRRGNVVVNIISPYSKYGFQVVKAAIEAGVNYVDICDSSQVTRDVFERLSDSAEEAGVTILIGLGGLPGLANMLARYGADQMDQVDEIHLAATGVIARATAHTWLHRFSSLGTVPMYKDGQWIDVEALNNFETVQFLEPGVTADLYPASSPPLVTIPRFIKGIRMVSCSLGHYPPEVNTFLHMLVSFGLASSEDIRIGDTEGRLVDFTAELLTSESVFKLLRGGVEERERWRAYLVRVKGKKARKSVMWSCHYCNVKAGNRNVTQPITLGAQMLAHGDIKTKGIIAPEALDPKPFMEEFKRAGAKWQEVREEL